MKPVSEAGTQSRKGMKRQFKIELSVEAEADFDNSYEYYAEQSPNLADSFYLSINQGFQNITNTPEGFQKIFMDIRRYVVNKFPFVIYYRVQSFSIQVIAIFHTSQSPQIWKKII